MVNAAVLSVAPAEAAFSAVAALAAHSHAKLTKDLPDCQCIGECDTTTATGLHYCVIGDDPQCSGVYGETAKDSIDGTTESDGQYEAYCGVIHGDYDCEGDPCRNGGYCIDGMNTFTCVCQPGYTGVECETNINECAEVPSPCAENAGCSDTPGSFECKCLSGFEGDGYVSDEGGGCVDVDDCVSTPCENGGSCADAGPNAFDCECAEGWIGATCESDVDECMDGTDTCDDDASCANFPGTFECRCNEGFTGDGATGTHIVVDESKTPSQQIVDYSGCSDIDDCANSPCLNDGTCNDVGPEAFMCFCSTGWEGIVCSNDINECADETHACDPNAACHNRRGGYECVCNSGFTGDGETCADADDCAHERCQHGGTCVDTGINSFDCDCSPGFIGAQCEKDVNECEVILLTPLPNPHPWPARSAPRRCAPVPLA